MRDEKSYADGFEKGSHVTLQTIMAWLDANRNSHIAGALEVASNKGELEYYRPELVASRNSAITP